MNPRFYYIVAFVCLVGGFAGGYLVASGANQSQMTAYRLQLQSMEQAKNASNVNIQALESQILAKDAQIMAMNTQVQSLNNIVQAKGDQIQADIAQMQEKDALIQQLTALTAKQYELIQLLKSQLP
jgi:SMC interacting uncharacterized protein involved in chromosome segregation